jgi:hypothetical protein
MGSPMAESSFFGKVKPAPPPVIGDALGPIGAAGDALSQPMPKLKGPAPLDPMTPGPPSALPAIPRGDGDPDDLGGMPDRDMDDPAANAAADKARQAADAMGMGAGMAPMVGAGGLAPGAADDALGAPPAVSDGGVMQISGGLGKGGAIPRPAPPPLGMGVPVGGAAGAIGKLGQVAKAPAQNPSGLLAAIQRAMMGAQRR